MSRPGNHKAVLAGTVLLAERAQRKAAKGIRRDLNPLVEAIRKAKSPAGLRKLLSPALAERMGTDGLGDALADAGVQAALIARVAATPKELMEG